MPKTSPIILPGIKPVLELLTTSPQKISQIFCRDNPGTNQATKLQTLCSQNGIPLKFTDISRLTNLCASAQNPHVSHQGVVAVLTQTEETDITTLLEQAVNAPLPLILALDQIQDPGNIGTLGRTAWAMGCAGLIMPKHNSAALGPAAARASAGALALIPCSRVVNLARSLDQAEEMGFTIYGSGCSGKSSNAFTIQWRLPAILVLGSEQRGLRQGVAKRCQTMLQIPLLREFDSLNVAQAGGILIALCARASLPHTTV